MASGPPFAVLLYASLLMALAVLSCLGIPWTPQLMGSLVFLSAFPFLWLNERREARMVQLLQTALQKAHVAPSGAVDPVNEGRLLFVSGPLSCAQGERLASCRWGAEAPGASAALRVQVEAFQPVRPWSWQRLTCHRGQWREDVVEVASEEHRAVAANVGAFTLDGMQLGNLDAWTLFAPRYDERLAEVHSGSLNRSVTAPIAVEDANCCCCRGAPHAPPQHHVARALGLELALPFPGEPPLVEQGGAVLYYPRGGGLPAAPELGDVRVSFLHLPCSPLRPFTAVGVQRGDRLESFRFRSPPPPGLSLGITGDGDFNLGSDLPCDDGYVPEKLQPMARAAGGYAAVCAGGADLDLAVQRQLAAQESAPRWLPPGCRALLGGCIASLEGWRQVLHRHVPEVLPCLAPGELGRCSFFLRAHGKELLLTWRLRLYGFMLMTAGAEIALWRWEAELALLGGVFAYALWAAVMVASGGFTAATAAAASIFYRPIAATLYLTSALALFAALFGWVALLAALGLVGGCMALLLACLACHLALPC